LKQSRDFDSNGDFIRMWVPELSNVPTEFIHTPWTMPKNLQVESETVLGKDYPWPIPCGKYTKR
jgi:deoxyribodipyrimidine photo-lyase